MSNDSNSDVVLSQFRSLNAEYDLITIDSSDSIALLSSNPEQISKLKLTAGSASLIDSDGVETACSNQQLSFDDQVLGPSLSFEFFTDPKKKLTNKMSVVFPDSMAFCDYLSGTMVITYEEEVDHKTVVKEKKSSVGGARLSEYARYPLQLAKSSKPLDLSKDRGTPPPGDNDPLWSSKPNYEFAFFSYSFGSIATTLVRMTVNDSDNNAESLVFPLSLVQIGAVSGTNQTTLAVDDHMKGADNYELWSSSDTPDVELPCLVYVVVNDDTHEVRGILVTRTMKDTDTDANSDSDTIDTSYFLRGKSTVSK